MTEHKQLTLQELIDQLLALRDQVGPDADVVATIDQACEPVVRAVASNNYDFDGLVGHSIHIEAIEGKWL